MSADEQPIPIMIADDHEITRIGLTVTLKGSRKVSVVAEANDGAQALEKARVAKPKVILMDLSMPFMDGIEATRAVKEMLPDVKVMILTTHDDGNEIFAALAAGADGYCLKTVGKSQLESAIVAVSEGGVWLDPKIARHILHLSQSGTPTPEPLPEREPTDFNLSQRELEVLALLVEGHTNQQMADHLRVGLETIKTHMRHIMEKMAVSDRTQAAVKAVRGGLVPPKPC